MDSEAREVGKLYIVATPIGNLGDITMRALDILKSVDGILCEDTRVISKLLAHFNIQKTLISYHHHSSQSKVLGLISYLESGKNLALVTDAGTPGISDPGNELVRQIADLPDSRQVGKKQIVIEPVPGVSAVVTALSVSGFPTDKFIFLGFPPHKNKRQKFFKEVAEAEYTVVFYESSHRIKKCFEELAGLMASERQMVVCRELTKKFESIYRGTIAEILSMDIPDIGEFVVVVSAI